MSIVFNSLPVDAPFRITSGFGPRNTGIAGASTFHKGVDLGRDFSKAQTYVLSVANGVVAANYWNAYRGWVVLIRHDSRYSTLYQHLKARSPLPVGFGVMAGQTLGVMGNSSDEKLLRVGVHLHFELRENGKCVNPTPYLKNIQEGDGMTEEQVRRIVREEMSGDGKPVSDWAKGFWSKMTDGGIVDGTSPQGVCTREQVATMLYKVMRRGG